MSKDILVNIKARDIQLRDTTDSKSVMYQSVWGNALDESGFDTSVSTLNVIIPIVRKKYIKYNDSGVLDILVTATYLPEIKNIKVRLLTYNGTDLAVFNGDGVPNINSAIICKTNNINVSDIPKACELPLINVDGNYLLHFDREAGKVSIYSAASTDFNIGVSDDQSSQILMLNAPGKMYRYPITGVDIYKYLNSVIEHSDLVDKMMSEFGNEERNIFDISFDSVTCLFNVISSKEKSVVDENLTEIENLDIDFISALMNYDFGNLIIYPESYIASNGASDGENQETVMPDTTAYIMSLYSQYKAYLRNEITINNSSDLADIIARINKLKSEIGELTNLETDAKNNLVDAINEVDANIGSGTPSTEVQHKLSIAINGNGGIHERGTTITPSAVISVKYDSTDVTSNATITPSSGTITNGTFSAPGISSAKTYTISASYNGKTASGTLSYAFMNYRYKGAINSLPQTDTEVLSAIQSVSKEFSESAALGATNLSANKYYIFAVVNTHTLEIRENSTNGIVDAAKYGTISVPRINGTGNDIYSYIVVPASEMSWAFKIS